MKIIGLIRLAVLGFLLSTCAWAALPPLSPEELDNLAYYRLEGRVGLVGKSEEYLSEGPYERITRYTAKLQTKDDGSVTIYYQRNHLKPQFTGDTGQAYLPKRRDCIPVYLDKNYHALEPNGIQSCQKH